MFHFGVTLHIFLEFVVVLCCLILQYWICNEVGLVVLDLVFHNLISISSHY